MSLSLSSSALLAPRGFQLTSLYVEYTFRFVSVRACHLAPWGLTIVLSLLAHTILYTEYDFLSVYFSRRLVPCRHTHSKKLLSVCVCQAGSRETIQI
jgi:hypothetical protein